jgi:hypothetical protein
VKYVFEDEILAKGNFATCPGLSKEVSEEKRTKLQQVL